MPFHLSQDPEDSCSDGEVFKPLSGTLVILGSGPLSIPLGTMYIFRKKRLPRDAA